MIARHTTKFHLNSPWLALLLGLAGSVLGNLDVAVAEDSAEQLAQPAAIEVPTGFTVDLVYAVPAEEQGSWVVMTADPAGRIYACDQRGSLYRVTVAEEAAKQASPAVQVEKVELDIGQAQGLLWAHDSLYVVVSGSAADGPGLYRLRDSDEDGELDTVKLLRKLELRRPATRLRSFADRLKHLVIRSGHGPHAVTLGPDGQLYIVAGNHTEIPQPVADTSPLRNWQEDVLLPREPDSQGIATGILAPGGYVARTDADGRSWELLAGGLRNPYDLTFNQDGELFVFDADMEFDTGTPWYRPSRINHIVSGGEYGWRYGTAKWPDYYADSIGAVVDVGFGSPTGVTFGTGARFPARYQQALFAGDWAYGRIFAMRLDPQGASYRGTFEVFAAAKPLPVVDLLVHPDGALYFLVGGRRTPSAIYRVRYVGKESTSPVKTATSLPTLPAADADPLDRKSIEQFREQVAQAGEARAERRRLEALHREPSDAALDTAWPYLNHPDRYLRYAARLAVQRQPVDKWRERALQETSPTASIHALLALARCGQNADLLPILGRLALLPWRQLSQSDTLAALRVYQLAFVRLGGATRASQAVALTTLDTLYPATSESVNRELCQLLVYLRAPQVIERTLAWVKGAPRQEDQLHGIFTLRLARQGWTPATRREVFTWLSVAEQKYQGGESFLGFVRSAQDRLTDQLSDDQRESLADLLNGQAVDEQVTESLPRQFVHNWQSADLLPDLATLQQGRNFDQGRAAYQTVGCAKCHRLAGKGASTGPDLTGVGARFSAQYLLEALLTPSRIIPDEYRTQVFVCRDGQVISGRLVGQTPDHLLVRTGPFASKPVKISRDEIEERRLSAISEMPAGLVNVLTKAEILDLLAYLRAGGRRDDSAFQDGD